MADAKADKVLSAGTEVTGNTDYFNFTDGLDAVANTDGGVDVGVKDNGVALAKVMETQAVTATDDGLTTGAITALVTGRKFVSVTSTGATKAVTLPAAATASIGQEVDIQVGANGYELLTPASSNNTINTVDSDGTNQLDVAANTLLRCVQITATGWACYQIAATTITVVAPDND
jgi:phage tail sheath gpL-like